MEGEGAWPLKIPSGNATHRLPLAVIWLQRRLGNVVFILVISIEGGKHRVGWGGEWRPLPRGPDGHEELAWQWLHSPLEVHLGDGEP